MSKRQETRMEPSVRRNILGPCALKFAAANTGAQRSRRPVADPSSCVACGICASFCPAGLICIDRSSGAVINIDFRYCKGCGICACECPRGCITMVPERSDD